MSYVFVSYHHSDSDFAEVLINKLEMAGFNTWVDNDQSHIVDDWRTRIDQVIKGASALIVVMSPEAKQSEYLTYEWAFAWGAGVKIIPVLLIPTVLHPSLAALAYLDFTVRIARPWQRLISTLEDISLSQDKRDSSKPLPPFEDSTKTPDITLQEKDSSSRAKEDQPKIEIFFSYAHEDEMWRKELDKQLSLLKRQGLISSWHDRQISAGTEWEKEINMHLNNAQIILLLVSPNFMSSPYCYSDELKQAIKRHKGREARVIPIILRPVDWKNAPFGNLQALPSEAKPITMWRNQDEAFFNVVKGIHRAIKEINGYLSSR